MEQTDRDDEMIKLLYREGYQGVKRLETGQYAGIMRMFYTAGLFVGLDESGYKTRYCYETMSEATAALLIWDGQGDPPGGWIKAKGEGRDQLNPNLREARHE
jgi:hypothetical protein